MIHNNYRMGISLARRIKHFIKALHRASALLNHDKRIAEVNSVMTDFRNTTGYKLNNVYEAQCLLDILKHRRFYNGGKTSRNSAPFARIGRAAVRQGKFINVSRYETRIALQQFDLREVPFSRIVEGYDITIRPDTVEAVTIGNSVTFLNRDSWQFNQRTAFITSLDQINVVVQQYENRSK